MNGIFYAAGKKVLVCRLVQGLRAAMCEKQDWMRMREVILEKEKNPILFLYPVVLYKHDTRLLIRCGLLLNDVHAFETAGSVFLN